MKRFVYRHVVQAPLEGVSSFYSDVRNLRTISPPFPRLSILTDETAVEEGKTFDLELDFIVFTIRWHSFIERVQPGSFFVDTSNGRFMRTWRHVHRYESTTNGTLMTDEVLCDPVWWIAPFVGIGLWILFAFRRRAIERVLR